ncbi:TetR/AcrR family transcriptional regulator [Streptomyces sp. NPDC088354]|uniref:TetR/AcrR family transcriptional regulator n=1 Tax=unclassified Streptomyces TaxID=2593676 RepID=UPI0029B3766D|nr:helix-turn-helix domain-containing protein [Streptomyces sp. MI02-7b]MDX3074004.1 helix-turn-helix domain containing protein [Streptomyces sp. MI02-7b]
MTRKVRADAADNHDHIIATAREAFAVEGVDLPMREIARRAGLGIATLYRHFPTRTDLISAALAGHVAACRADMQAAQKEPDAWTALSGAIRQFAEHQIRAPGLNEALLGSHTAGDAFRADRQAHAAALEQLVARAHQQHVLRRGTTVADVRVVLMALSSLRPTQATRRPEAIRILLDLLLAGLRTPGH